MKPLFKLFKLTMKKAFLNLVIIFYFRFLFIGVLLLWGFFGGGVLEQTTITVVYLSLKLYCFMLYTVIKSF